VGEGGVEGVRRRVWFGPGDVSSTAQSTKHPPVSFKIFVAGNGTRRVEVARS
jgi:hypothetical protein